MFLYECQLDVFVEECEKLFDDPDYLSVELYDLLTLIATRYLMTNNYTKIFQEWKDEAILDSIVKCIKPTNSKGKPSGLRTFSAIRGEEARLSKGYDPDYKKAWYTFAETIIRNQVYSTIVRLNTRKIQTYSIDTVGEDEPQQDIASISSDIADLNTRIDEWMQDKHLNDPNVINRAIEFEKKLDELEPLVKGRKRNVRASSK